MRAIRLGGRHRATHDLQELGPVAVFIFAEAALGQLQHGSKGEVAFVLRIAQQEAEAGHGRGELKVTAGCAEMPCRRR